MTRFFIRKSIEAKSLEEALRNERKATIEEIHAEPAEPEPCFGFKQD